MKKPTRANNRIVLDLNKVSYAWFYYRNQYNDALGIKPTAPTLFGKLISVMGKLAIGPGHEPETLYERARRLDRLDKWLPVFRARMTSGDILEYTGDKAKALNQAWCAKQFGGDNK